jgi:hypothetical protein
MSAPIPDPWPAMQEAAQALGAEGQPQAIFGALDRILGGLLGHKLFTIMVRHHNGESERNYSNQPGPYPVGGRKQMQNTPWFRDVIQARKHFLGRTAADVRWAFFDHALIASLGCGSAMNLLAIHDGQVVGAINMLHEEHWYDERHIAAGAPFAQLLVPAFLKLRG